jgi:hypothetical protein
MRTAIGGQQRHKNLIRLLTPRADGPKCLAPPIFPLRGFLDLASRKLREVLQFLFFRLRGVPFLQLRVDCFRKRIEVP